MCLSAGGKSPALQRTDPGLCKALLNVCSGPLLRVAVPLLGYSLDHLESFKNYWMAQLVEALSPAQGVG